MFENFARAKFLGASSYSFKIKTKGVRCTPLYGGSEGNRLACGLVSLILAGFVCGAFLLIAYFIGAMLGGAISGLSFDLHGLNAGNIVMCMIAKIFLMLVFVSIDVIVSVGAKQKAWLCLCGSLAAGMLLFMMVGMITPLGSTVLNVVLCAAGGALFAFGLGEAGKAILKKTSLV